MGSNNARILETTLQCTAVYHASQAGTNTTQMVIPFPDDTKDALFQQDYESGEDLVIASRLSLYLD